MSEITEFQIKVIPDMHLEKGLMITSFEGFETFRKFLASRNELKEENARLRETLEQIALNHSSSFEYWDSQGITETVNVLLELMKDAHKALGVK